MAFDFFNEGIKKESAIQFTKEENMFLESKLPFLDPKKTEQISIGSALEFLKFSGIRSEGIQKILKNCKIQLGKKTISYNQMKKLFRGVALHQSDIQPSTINIEANIKTKAPLFYDDESDEEGSPNPPPAASQPPKVQEEKPIVQTKPVESIQQKPVQDNPQHRQKPVQDKQNVFSFEAPSKPPSQYPPQPIQTPTFPQNTKEKESGLSIKIREFEARWVKLKTEGNKISGGEVKTLCKNFGQRSNLSKAWKVCCHTHSGALTKGEFFIFLQIVTSPNIPETLTQEMKQNIALLDKETSQKELKPQNLTPQQPPLQKLASSMIFENFGKADSSVDVRGRVKTEEKIELSSMIDHSKTLSQLQQVSKVAQNHTEEMTTIRRGQQTMTNILGEVQQFLTNVKSRNNETRGQVNQLKDNQQLLNDRLNKVCVALNGIIVSQNSLIEELTNDYANQNNLNFQRVSFLQNHVAQLTEQLQQKEQTIRRMLSKQDNHPSPPYQSKGHLNEPEPEPEGQPQIQPHPQKSQQANREQVLQEPQVQRISHSRQESPNVPAHQGSPPAQSDIKLEDNQYEQRMKMKRAQVIQLIMHLTPLTPEEEPALIQRISEYSEEELNTVYYNCYQKLKARQVAQQQAAERVAHQTRESLPPDDEFKSSNFHGQPTSPQKNMFDD